MMEAPEDDDPIQGRQVPFGAGLKRKRIEFVSAKLPQSEENNKSDHASTTAGDRYLAIVFNKSSLSIEPGDINSERSDIAGKRSVEQAVHLNRRVCEICSLPLVAPDDERTVKSMPHEASIAHMVCLKHSHPPSDLDRNRQGLKYLSSYGWDPDSRRGLGAAGEGIRAPIKAKVKHDTIGLGVDLERLKKAPEKVLKKLDAKQARKKDLEDSKKREKLQEMFYGNDDVEKYLTRK